MSLYIIGIMVVFSVVLLVYALWPSKKNEESEAIKRRMSGRRVKSSVASIRKQAKESVAKRVMTTVAPIAVKPVMMSNADDISKLRLRLATAGLVLSWLLVWTLEGIPVVAWRYVIAFIVASGFGALMEWCQTRVPGRFGTLADVGLNTAGAVIGLLAALLLLHGPG